MKDTLIRAGNRESSVKYRLNRMSWELRSNNRAQEYKTKLNRVKGTKTLNENIEKVLEFDRESGQNGLSFSTRYSSLITLHNLCQFAGSKPFKCFSKSDIIDFLDAAQNRHFEDTRYRARTKAVENTLSGSTMNHIKFQVKRFFQWLHGMKKGEYPVAVEWLDIKPIRGDREILRQKGYPKSLVEPVLLQKEIGTPRFTGMPPSRAGGCQCGSAAVDAGRVGQPISHRSTR